MSKNMKTSGTLRKEASHVLENTQLLKELEDFTYCIIGSYALDVMCWPDIDINILYRHEHLNKMYQLGAYALSSLHPIWCELRKTTDESQSPGHYFLGFESVISGTLWNFDLWFLTQREFLESQQWLEETHTRLTTPLRETIIQIKQDVINVGMYHHEEARSIDVYEAVLDHNIATIDDFKSWFVKR